jgi:two-component system response regulator ResD
MSCIILIAEDDVLIRNSARMLLQADGHDVLVARDGDEALRLSREYQGEIDMLLTAVKLPGIDGLELVAQIVKERPGIKILVMSSKISGEGINLPFLSKPFSPAGFREKVREVLKGDGPVS